MSTRHRFIGSFGGSFGGSFVEFRDRSFGTGVSGRSFGEFRDENTPDPDRTLDDQIAPAVSHKELEKALHEAKHTDELNRIQKMKARIELIANFEDLKRVRTLLQGLSTNPPDAF
jgi:hypothetical protein